MADSNGNLTPEQQAKLQKNLDQAFKLTLKKREWIVIYNVLASQQYRLGDAKVVNSIVDQIQPIVASDTNVPENPHEEGVIVQ